MSVIDKIDIFIETTALKQQFSDIKELAKEIEHMDLNVDRQDRRRFDKIANKYLDKVDPQNKLSMMQAVIKLGDKKAMLLYNELSDLHYRG